MSDSKNNELKPCPFCGSGADEYTDSGRDIIECKKCSCNLQEIVDVNPDVFSEGLYESWNTRAGIATEWISVEDRLPPYGLPVILSIKGTVQYVTYMLDGADDTKDWFEPYHFDHDDNTKLWYDDANHWMPLPEPPKS